MTNAQRQYEAENPITIKNVRSLGSGYGRYVTMGEAKRIIGQWPETKIVGEMGTTLLIAQRVS